MGGLGLGDFLIQSGLIAQMPWAGAGAVALGSEGCFEQEPWQTAAELRQADMELGASKLGNC